MSGINDERTLVHSTTGQVATGYTLELHEFVDGNTKDDYSSSTLVGTYSETDEKYHLHIASTIKAVWILKNPADTVIKKRPDSDDRFELIVGDDTPLLP